MVEKVQRSFTRFISGVEDLSYPKRLTTLKLFSLQRRRERYIIIYVWKILEGLVPNLFPPICTKTSDRRGRTCITSHINVGRLGTLEYNGIRWRAIHLFNQLPLFVCNAFDKVDHGILLYKLKALGITGHLGIFFPPDNTITFCKTPRCN